MKAIWVYVVLVSLALTMPVPLRAGTVPVTSYSQSPAQAVRRVFQIERILRINIVEPYAIVSARGSGPLFTGSSTEFLLEHFDFGWQVLEMARALCARERRITPPAARRLMAGMPKQYANNVGCDERDSGPSRSIDQVRKLMPGPVVPFVRVAAEYAYSEDYGDGGGCGLFHFEARADRWKIIAGCKGAMDTSAIERYHIPHTTLCALRVSVPDLECPRKT